MRFGSWCSKIAKAGLRVGDTCAVVCEPGFGSLGAVEIPDSVGVEVKKHKIWATKTHTFLVM